MKKYFVTLLLLIILIGCAQASILYRIRFSHYPDKIRIVFDFDGSFTYDTIESKEEIAIFLRGIEAGPDIGNYFDINDMVVKYLSVEKQDDGSLKITIPLSEQVKYNVFYLNDPPRLVVDFDREFLNITSSGLLARGVEHLQLKKGLPKGRIEASILKIDLKKVKIEPALAGKGQANIIGSIVDFLTPWRKKDPSQGHFYLESVSDMAKRHKALAAVNGTFFAYTGRPLGALIIDGEIVSYPIHDRTAFFLDTDNNPYINNVFLRAYLKIQNGPRYKISGINQIRRANDTILYTPWWGEITGTNTRGIELVVAKRRVEEINLSNSRIPKDGYVVSLTGPAVEVLTEQVKKWDGAQLQLNVIPYSTSPKNIAQLISGGPRLIKNGYIYISKHEEKFQADVAKRRAARTAIGITKDKKLLLVTVKNPKYRRRQAYPVIGVTLEELAELMKNLGAYNAMNLDGGSSTTMVINGKTVTGGSRHISNAILVMPKN